MCAVEWKSLEELGDFYGGLSGKSKDDFQDGNAKFVTYMNVYSNFSLDFSITDMVKVEENEKQNSIKYGDILFTGSSETPDDCGMSCVVTNHVNESIYLNSFCFGFRFYDIEKFEPNYLKHYFRCLTMRKTISLTASGVTRFNVSKKRFGKIQIPLLTISKQQEIASHLDTFTTLISNLESELDMRRKQYEHYRNQLLDFEGVEGVEWKSLGEIGEFVRGNGIQKKDFVEEGFGCIHYGQVYTQFRFIATEVISRINKDLYEKCRKANYGDIVLATTSENVEDVAKPVIWLGDEKIAVSSDAFIYKHNQNPIYIGSQFLTNRFFHFKVKNVTGAKVIRLSGESMANYRVAIPSLDKQNEIAENLKSFENLIQSLEQEIKLRKQQYEYYREKLLTFEKE